jgi:LacI family transcriptional regulator
MAVKSDTSWAPLRARSVFQNFNRQTMKRGASAVTVDDVAAHAGVSIKTVSRVLNHEPNISEKTRAKVVEAMQALDYRPNPAARRLASKRADIIALVYDNPSDNYIVTSSTARSKPARRSTTACC